MLILTEKPSVARAFADSLGIPKKDGYWENGEYCVTNALGHLLEDFSPEDYDPSLKKWALEGLPIIPEKVKFKIIEKTKKQLSIVKKCFDRRRDDPLLLATDAEREGELIGAEILDYVGFKNYSSARRFWVSEALTPEVIKTGVKNAKPLAEYKSYREQGFARQQADWLVGMNLTRLLTLKSGKLLHFGRVQTALLGAIYERDKSIANFTAEPYSEIKAVLKGESAFSVKLINPENEEFPSRFLASQITTALLEVIEKAASGEGKITEINKEQKSVYPPQLYNLTALQKDAHKQFGYSPEKTLDIAQALYEKHKCLSYPRTPSRVMGDENVALVKGIFDKLSNSAPEEDLSGIVISPDDKRVFNSADLQDHHALIPLSLLPKEVTDEEKNIYNLVLKSFLNVFKPPYVYNSVDISVDISGLLFKGSGIDIIKKGWKSSAGADEDDEEKEENYTGIGQGKEYPVESIKVEQKKTTPKKHYTFASLLQLMENPREDGKRLAGLGTPATRGAILQKIVDRKYVQLKGKNVLITDDGKFLVENVLNNGQLAAFISIPETTRWEEQLHENTEVFLSGIKDFVINAVKNTSTDTYKKDKKSLGKCPLCGADVYEGKMNYYCSNNKKEKNCFTVWKEISGAAITLADAAALLSGKKTKLKKCHSHKTGKDFEAYFVIKDGKVEMRFEEKG
jgi:DNA topoisomerase-3